MTLLIHVQLVMYYIPSLLFLANHSSICICAIAYFYLSTLFAFTLAKFQTIYFRSFFEFNQDDFEF